MPDSLFQRLIKDVSARTGRPVAEEPAARFEETVNVTADPWKSRGRIPRPPEMAEIHLGSATEPPTGTYLPPDVQPTNAFFEGSPKLAEAWKRMQTAYPSVARYASAQTAQDVAGTNRLGYVDDAAPRTININPTLEYMEPSQQDDILRHELTHVANNLNFDPGVTPSRRASENAAEWTEQSPTAFTRDSLLRALDTYRAARSGLQRSKTGAY
jgi:hypothetical protein